MAEEFVTEEELVNGDPELSGTNYDEMLDIIMGNEFMRRPDVQSGWTTTEDGQAITNYEAMSNEERKAAWDEWYNAATEYGVENLNGSELMAYVATGYRLGYLTAEEADEYYDQAWSEMSAANGWELQDDGVTWRKEREGGGGRTIVETRTQPSFADGAFGESGAWDGNIGKSLGPGTWTDYDLNPLLSQENYTRVVEDSFVSKYFKPALAIGASLITGGAAAGALGGLSGWMSGAVSSALGSATGQLLVTGELDADSLFKAALLGATGGLFNDLSGMDASIFEDATGLTGAADDAVTALSDMLNIPYDQALNIAKGVVDGTIKGNDLEGIVAGAAASYTQGQVMDYLKDAYGDTVNVDDWFKDGESHIPVEALDPFVGQIIGGIADGSIDDAGAWAETLYNYFQAGGDVDFMLPGVPEGGDWQDWMSVTFPDIDFGFELPDIDLPDVDLPSLPDVDLPDIDIDVPSLPDVDLPDIDVDVPDLELPDVDLDGPDIDFPDLPSIDIDLPKLEFRGSKPFGEDLKQFTPLGAPQLAQQTQIIPKAQFQGYDPRRSGSPIVASLFSEYLG